MPNDLYIGTKTIADVQELKPIFERAKAAGVAIAVCADNPAMHGDIPKLVPAYERLVPAGVIHVK